MRLINTRFPDRLWLILGFCLMALVSCRKSIFGKTKSYVGMEAGGVEGAPTFNALQDWFNNSDRSLSEEVAKKNSGMDIKFSEKRWDALPEAYKQGFLSYFEQQLERIGEFQAAADDKAKLTELLDLEAKEMRDIILVLLFPKYEPKTEDKLAIFISRVNSDLRDLISFDFQAKALDYSLFEIRNSIDLQMARFSQGLKDKYLDNKGANAEFRAALTKNCTDLKKIIVSLKGKLDEKKCDSASAANLSAEGLNLNDPYGSYQNLYGGFNGSAGMIPNLIGGAYGMGMRGDSPNLSIFQGKDLNSGRNYNYGGSGYGGNYSSRNYNGYGNGGYGSGDYGSGSYGSGSYGSGSYGSGGYGSGGYGSGGYGSGGYGSNYGSYGGDTRAEIEDLKRQVASLQRMISEQSVSDLGRSTRSPRRFSLTSQSAKTSDLPEVEKPTENHCKDLKDLDLVLCSKISPSIYGSKPSVMVVKSASVKKKSSLSLDQFGSTRTQNFDLITRFSTPVQDQGQEGACSAFGLMHTLEANVNAANARSRNPRDMRFVFDAKEQWALQNGQSDPTSAISVAEGRNFGGFRIDSGAELMLKASVDAFKSVLAQNRAIYVSHNVDPSWTSYKSPGQVLPLSCGAGGSGSHAYAIVGYDDDEGAFIIKNSWGTWWGDQGYGYLPYNCIPQLQIQLYTPGPNGVLIPAGQGPVHAYDVPVVEGASGMGPW